MKEQQELLRAAVSRAKRAGGASLFKTIFRVCSKPVLANCVIVVISDERSFVFLREIKKVKKEQKGEKRAKRWKKGGKKVEKGGMFFRTW